MVGTDSASSKGEEHCTRDPSLPLKNGSVQDDANIVKGAFTRILALQTIAGQRRGLVHLRSVPGNCYQSILNRALFPVIRGVLLNELFLLLRDVFKRMNRVRGAGGDASATVDAAFRIYIHLGGSFEARLVRLGVNAVSGANLDAKRIFDAVVSNYIGHDRSVSWNECFSLSSRVYGGGSGWAVISVT